MTVQHPAILAELEGVRAQLPATLTALVEATAELEAVGEGDVGLAVRGYPDAMLFCLIAGDPRTVHELDELTRAFVGLTSARRGTAGAHLSGGAFASAVHALAANGSVALLLAPEATRRRCGEATALMMEVRRRRPATAVALPRPLARVLRDLEDAIAREDVLRAREHLDEAWATGRLSLVNRSLLEARVLACERRWADVLQHVLRYRLGDLHLPASVQHDVIRAVWARFLAGPAASGDVDGAIAVYRQEVTVLFGGAFQDHRAAVSAEARAAWMVRYASAQSPGVRAAADEILAAAESAERPLLDELAARLPAAEDATESMLRELLSGGDAAAAWALVKLSQHLPAAVREDALRRAAAALHDPIREAQVVDAEEPTATPETARTARVDGWHGWLQELFEDPEWPEAVDVLDAHADGWDRAPGRSDAQFAEMADTIEATAGVAALRAALPRLARFVVASSGGPGSGGDGYTRLLQALRQVIVTEPHPGFADLEALTDIASIALDAGLDEERYCALIGDLVDSFARLGAPPSLAHWVVSTVQVLVAHGAPSGPARDDGVRRLIAPLLADAQRARPLVVAEAWVELVEVLEGRPDLVQVLGDQGRMEAAQDVEEGAFAALAGQKVLLYTLIEKAGARAADYLSAAVPSVEVAVASDAVASDGLRQHARTADLIIVASRAAKHAAYDCIQASASRPIRYAAGKGWSSLVTAARGWASEQ